MTTHPYPYLSSLGLHDLTTEDAYIKIDQEIAELHTRIRSLRTLRNTLSPISKVPAEVLSRIFLHAQQDANWPKPFSKAESLHRRFIVSWVCRYWRDIAITTPRLWTTIYCRRLTRMTKELLVRSGASNLAINVLEPTNDVLETFTPEMHRIQHLSIRSLDRSITPEFNRFLTQPAPVLASLKLEGVNTPQPSFFSGIHPQLHDLVLMGIDLKAPSALITPTLTRLTLDTLSDGNHLIDVLPSLHHLIELVLDMRSHGRGELAATRHERIRLPNLKILSITKDDAEHVFQFLRCFDIPHTAITTSTWSSASVERFASNLQNYFKDTSITIHHVAIQPLHRGFSARLSSSPLQHRYSFEFPRRDIYRSGDVTALFFSDHIFPIGDLETLSLEESPIAKVIALSPNLKNLSLFGACVLADFIWECKFNPLRQVQKLFPALKELTIYNIRFEQFDGLNVILAARVEAGIGLDKLVFVNCPWVDIDEYREFVNMITVVNRP